VKSYKAKTIENESHLVSAPRTGEFFGEGLIHVIWQRRLIVLLAVVVTVGAALVYLTRVTPVYTSTSRLYVEQTGPEIITEQEGVMTQSKNYLHTQKELLRSTPILALVADDPAVRGMKTLRRVSNIIAYLKGRLNVTVGNRDDLISVSFDSPYPQEAAQLVNAVVDSYITNQSTSKRSSSKDVLKILYEGKARRDKESDEKLRALLEFTRVNGVVSLENSNDNIIVHRLGRLCDALTEVQLEIMAVKADYIAVNAIMGDTEQVKHFLNSHRGQGEYLSSRSQYDQLCKEMDGFEEQLKTLLQLGTRDLPAVQAIELEIARLKRRITEEENNLIQGYRAFLVQRWTAALQKEAGIRDSMEKQQKLALELNAKAAEYAMLKSDLDRSKKLCDEIDNRIKNSNVTEDTGALNISIVEVARPADRATFPQKDRFVAVSLVLGLMLGLVLALLCDWMDHRLRSADEISVLLGVPVLGAVPTMAGNESNLTRGQKVFLEPVCPAAEAYRAIRTAIYFGAGWAKVKTILVTSASEGDGKTTVISNLAAAMAQSGQRTLIIDADFRKPMQHKIFKINRLDGLSGVLSGKCQLDQAVESTVVSGLDILPSGVVTANPSEMLSSEGFMGVLEEVSQMYDRILIDSPPVLNVTDACILGAVCDGTVLVVHAEKTARKSAEQACDNLFSVGTNVLGVVVNDVSPAKNRYGYYGSYKYYSYRYGDSSTGRESAEDVSPKPVVIKTQAENINQYHGPSRNEKKLSRSSGTLKSDSDKNE